jgi:hypothetical protein
MILDTDFQSQGRIRSRSSSSSKKGFRKLAENQSQSSFRASKALPESSPAQGGIQAILDSLRSLSRSGCGADMNGGSDFCQKLNKERSYKIYTIPVKVF